jgi:hypothetical protein
MAIYAFSYEEIGIKNMKFDAALNLKNTPDARLCTIILATEYEQNSEHDEGIKI